MDLENFVHGGRAVDVTYGLPVQGKPGELPGGEIPTTSGDKYGDANTFYAPSYSGHRGHFEGGKYPTPTVPPMRHAGTLAYNERKSPCHCIVCKERGSEEAVVSGGGIEGEHGEGI